MAIYKVPTSVLEACKKELDILSTSFSNSQISKGISTSKLDAYFKKKSASKKRARKLIKLLEDNYGV